MRKQVIGMGAAGLLAVAMGITWEPAPVEAFHEIIAYFAIEADEEVVQRIDPDNFNNNGIAVGQPEPGQTLVGCRVGGFKHASQTYVQLTGIGVAETASGSPQLIFILPAIYDRPLAPGTVIERITKEGSCREGGRTYVIYSARNAPDGASGRE